MPNYMQMGGNRIPLDSYPGMTSAAFYGGNTGTAMPFTNSSEQDRTYRRRRQQEEEQRKQEEAARIVAALYGMNGGPQSGPSGPGRGFPEGPISSEMGALNNSYKTRGNAPRYHEEMPYGGTPGVWAIRNDEIAGPREDPFQYMSPRDWAASTGRSIGRRFGRRR